MISVIIPTRNDLARLGPCLGGLAPAIVDPILSEVIFVDASDEGGPDAAGVAQVAEETGARLIAGPPDPAARLTLGAAAARGAWRLFLSPEARLAPDWVAAARDFMKTAEPAIEGRAGLFAFAFDAPGLAPRLAAAALNRAARRGGMAARHGLLAPNTPGWRPGETPWPRPWPRPWPGAAPLGARLLLDPARWRDGGWLRETMGQLRGP